MARDGGVFDLKLVKEEPPVEQWDKVEVDIEEHELLQHPRSRDFEFVKKEPIDEQGIKVEVEIDTGLQAQKESQLHPAESSDSAETEALPDTRQAAPERDIKLEPESLTGEGCNEVTITEEEALVAGRWFNSRVVLVDCGAALRHSDNFCAECGRLCSSRSALLRHQQAHCAPECDDAPRPPEGAGDKAARRYECDICHYTSKARRNIVCHLKTHTEEKPYKCNLCDYRSGKRSNLTRHLRTHTGEKPFKCNFCDYGSVETSNLTRHLRTHTGEKPFKCNLCDYRSVTRNYLTYHMRTHTGEKPFKCNLCDYRSAKRSGLTTHMRTHTGEKPFKCSLCDYRSVESSNLTNHMRTHSGKKPFKCSLCDYRSVQRSNLSNHMRSHTGKKPFKCNYVTIEVLDVAI